MSCAIRFFIVMAVFLGLSGCERHAPSKTSSEHSGTNVLLITLDTTRADRLGCYGYSKAQTPTIDGLADSGVMFENAYCQVPLTLPSHTSLLTSTYPKSNGLRVNGAAALGSSTTTVAEVFSDKGYRTGAFVSAAVLDAAFGLNRGFGHYDDDLGSTHEGEGESIERRANVVCDAALQWLEEDSKRPFFAWVHFFDPHHPYEPPAEYVKDGGDPYDGEIAFVDSQIGRFVQWLDKRGLRNNTLIVIAGDHGEAFEEHGEIQHGLFVYDTTIRVPLIFSLMPVTPQGKAIPDVVGLVDVFPTVMEVMGWESPDTLAGQTLVPSWVGRAEARPVYCESLYPHLAYGWAGLRCMVTEKWKYIDCPRPELYDLDVDPGESRNLFVEQPEVVSKLAEELDVLVSGMEPLATDDVGVDAKLIGKLESLGYVGAVKQGSDDIATGRDPKEMVDAFNQHTRAVALLRRKEYAEVVRLMERLVRMSPESDEFQATLARAYLGVHRYAEGEKAFLLSLRQVPTNPDRLCGLGDALRGQGRVTDAIASYEAALATSPNYGQAHNRLGLTCARQRDFVKAAKHFRRCAELEPRSPKALSNLAGVLAQTKNNAEAEKLLREALMYDKGFAPAHRLLWQVVLGSGQRQEAIQSLRSALEYVPDDVTLKRNLAALLATTPGLPSDSRREAMELADQCCRKAPNVPENLEVLAAAYAGLGDYKKAIEIAEHALSIAESQGNQRLANRIRSRLQAYHSGGAQ